MVKLKGLKILWSESSVRVRVPPPAPSHLLFARLPPRVCQLAPGSSLDVNSVFELGAAKRYDSAIFPAYYLKMLQHE